MVTFTVNGRVGRILGSGIRLISLVCRMGSLRLAGVLALFRASSANSSICTSVCITYLHQRFLGMYVILTFPGGLLLVGLRNIAPCHVEMS